MDIKNVTIEQYSKTCQLIQQCFSQKKEVTSQKRLQALEAAVAEIALQMEVQPK